MQSKPLLLDLFCKAGGASRGYADAGFDVVGCDIEAQSRYPYDFVQMDALECLLRLIAGESITFKIGRVVYLRDIAAIHASPPCQVHSVMAHLATPGKHKDLIPETRSLLHKTGKAFVIENVVGAPLINPVRLCGTMFGLGTSCGAQLLRHRLFETNWFLMCDLQCRHGGGVIGVSPVNAYDPTTYRAEERFPNRKENRTIMVVGDSPRDPRAERERYRPKTISITGSTPQQNVERNVVRVTFPVSAAREAMGIDWMPMKDLSQAVPPAYTQYIGAQLLEAIAYDTKAA